MPASGVADRNRHQRAVVFPTLVSYRARRKPNIGNAETLNMNRATTAKYLIRLAATAALTLALAACGSSSGSSTSTDPAPAASQPTPVASQSAPSASQPAPATHKS